MTVRDYILGGVEAELALQRMLGVRVIDVDVAALKKAPELRAAAETPEAEPAAAERRAARSVGAVFSPVIPERCVTAS